MGYDNLPEEYEAVKKTVKDIDLALSQLPYPFNLLREIKITLKESKTELSEDYRLVLDILSIYEEILHPICNNSIPYSLLVEVLTKNPLSIASEEKRLQSLDMAGYLIFTKILPTLRIDK